MTAARRLAAIAIVVTTALAPVVARAHAHLDHASPAVNGTVAEAPKDISLWFTEALEARFCTVEVRNASGTAMHVGKARAAKDNTAQLVIAVKPLPPGTYTVTWKVLSVDTHRTSGSFTFTVGQ